MGRIRNNLGTIVLCSANLALNGDPSLACLFLKSKKKRRKNKF